MIYLSSNITELFLEAAYPTVGENFHICGVQITAKWICESKKLKVESFTHALKFILSSRKQRGFIHSPLGGEE